MFGINSNKIFKTLFILSVLTFCWQSAFAKEELRYTKYNIHGQSLDGVFIKASYANYTNPGDGHIIVPAGTKINISNVTRKSFAFTYDAGKKKVVFEFHAPRMGMKTGEYIELITSAEPTSQKNLSQFDRKGVKQGKASVGMTKEGVLAALGYPAVHRTPSLDASRWVYWANRFRTIAVNFDASGKVSSIDN